MTNVFIDGQAGTTGLELASRLAKREDLTILQIPEDSRKDLSARSAIYTKADIVILCLPDQAAVEAAEAIGDKCKVIDASTAHRTHKDWTYGLPELTSTQRQRIAGAEKVSHPGCYPQGYLLLVRPLIEEGILSAETLLRCNALSGYSGGGKAMISKLEKTPFNDEGMVSRIYGLNLDHKHVSEMQIHSGSQVRPIFIPTVCSFYRGMTIQISLFSSELNGHQAKDVYDCLHKRYENERFIKVIPFGSSKPLTEDFLNPLGCNETNEMELMVFGNREQIHLIARYDNLVKGAAGSAIQNLNIMLGCDENIGLI